MQLSKTLPRALTAVSVLGLLAIPAAAVDGPILAGSDLFATPGDGDTFVNFFQDPLPAGFFCERSEPYTGLIPLQGVPLQTSPERALGNTDTIVQRLDDAIFDPDGMAVTRIRVAALSLESIDPIRTACGEYTLRVTPDGGPQPVTRMQIFQTHRYGGFFLAPLHMRVQLTFEPLDGGEPLVLVREFQFPADDRDHTWAYQSAADGLRHPAYVSVRSGQPGDPGYLTLPGTSNFAAMWGVPEVSLSGDRDPRRKEVEPQRATTGHTDGAHLITPPNL